MSGCAGSLRSVLEAQPCVEEGRFAEGEILLFPESDGTGGVLLRLFHSGGVQGGILYDHIPDFSDSGASGRNAGRVVSEALLCRSRGSLRGIFCVAAERNVCSGCASAAVFELDF